MCGMGDWTTLSVTKDTVEQLKEAKPPDMSWNEYLYGIAEDGTIAESAGDPQGAPKFDEVLEKLDRIESAATTAEDRTGDIQRTLEGLR